MRTILPLALMVLTGACGGGGSSAPPPTPPPPATTCPIPVAKVSPSLAADLVPALQASCGSATTTCHGGASATGHIDFSGTATQIRTQLVNATPANAPAGWLRVVPGDPAHSWLMVKVTQDQPGGTGYGTRMPQGAPNLCQPTLDTLSAWISAGALNN